jgi:hypothetical protein
MTTPDVPDPSFTLQHALAEFDLPDHFGRAVPEMSEKAIAGCHKATLKLAHRLQETDFGVLAQLFRTLCVLGFQQASDLYQEACARQGGGDPLLTREGVPRTVGGAWFYLAYPTIKEAGFTAWVKWGRQRRWKSGKGK